MTIYMLTALSENKNQELSQSVHNNIAPNDILEVQDGLVWFLNFAGDVSELATKLGLQDGEKGHYLITPVYALNGFTKIPLVDWIKAKKGEKNVQQSL